MNLLEELALIIFLLCLAGGMYAAIAWLPALGVSLWLMVKESKSRKVLVPLFLLCLLCLVWLRGVPHLEKFYEIRLRAWLTTIPAYLLILAAVLFLILTARYALRRVDRCWKKWLLRAGAVLSVWGVIIWGFLYLAFICRPETVGEWQGQKTVMESFYWMEETHTYYRYNGPFLLGEELGWSLEPWGPDAG